MIKYLLLLLALPIFANEANYRLGIPKSNSDTLNLLIHRYQYTVNYAPQFGSPQWVAWNLDSAWYGDVDRYEGNFITDKDLPLEMQIKHSDYTNSGYDRGHLVRSEERTATVEDNKSTFIMSNIIPQTPELNRQTWLSLEYYCEKLCKEANKELYIVAGPHYPDTIVYINKKVAIPDSCFKVIIILERGQGLESVTENTQTIAVMMPNDANVKDHPWTDFKRTIRSIEQSTGIDFNTNIAKNLQDIIENQISSSVETDKPVSFSIRPSIAYDYIEVSGITEFNVVDLTGNTILKSNTTNISVSNLAPGLYFVQHQNSSVPFFVVR